DRGVGNGADHALRLQLSAAGHGGCDANIGLSAPRQQERLQAGQQCHEESRASAVAQRAQAREEIIRYLDWFLRNTRCQLCALKLSIGPKDRWGLPQTVLPVGKLRRCCVAGGPSSLPASEVAKPKRWFGQLCLPVGCKGGIEFGHLFDENPHRPPVDDEIVQNQKQNVVVGAEPPEPRPEQGRTVQIEGFQGLLLNLQLRLFAEESLGPAVSSGCRSCKIGGDEPRTGL